MPGPLRVPLSILSLSTGIVAADGTVKSPVTRRCPGPVTTVGVSSVYSRPNAMCSSAPSAIVIAPVLVPPPSSWSVPLATSRVPALSSSVRKNRATPAPPLLRKTLSLWTS